MTPEIDGQTDGMGTKPEVPRMPPAEREGRLAALVTLFERDQQSDRRTRWLRRLAPARPVLFTIPVGLVVALLGTPDYDAASLQLEYSLRTAVVGFVIVGAACWWWTARPGRAWGADLVPALLGGIGALTLVGSLNGTPYAPGGLNGDQTFRTAAITRFAESWHNADFTFQGLPSFYAPAYFWVYGRFADLSGVEPWRMVKLGTVVTALLVPVVSYLMWRRLVPAQVAPLLAAVPLLVENFYEPYSWLVMVAIVPWWLEAVHGLRRPGRQPGHPALLGLFGGLLFMTYYYFFFVATVALVIHLATESALRRLRWQQVLRAGIALSTAAAVSSVFWLPLLASILRAEQPESLANRWFSSSHPDLPLPMFELTVTGALSLLGLGFLVWTVREPLSRGLLVFLAGAYCWYLIGGPAAAAGLPLLSFRGKLLIPLILLIAAALALVRLAQLAADKFNTVDVRRVAAVFAALLVIYAGQEFVTSVRTSPLTEAAFASATPEGRLPERHPAGAVPTNPPATLVHRVISERYTGNGQPIILSDRVDVMVLYPYYGFLQWNAHFAHPAAEFHARVRFLEELANATGPAQFTAQSAENRFDRIDVFLLRDEGDQLALTFAEDDFPDGIRPVTIRFPRLLFADFTLVPLREHVLAVRPG
jgi:galactan 5-O-arabinofuranosyltransferase